MNVIVVMQNDTPIGVALNAEATERIFARVRAHYPQLVWEERGSRWTGEAMGHFTIYLWAREFSLEE